MRWLTLKNLKRARVWAPVVAFATFACVSPPLESPGTKVTQQTPIRVAQNVKNKVDVLFLVDSSNSMSAMSDQLKDRFGQFFKVFQDLATKGTYADLQIGVVSSDYGAGSTGAPGCQPSPGGQQGKLIDIGAAAPNTCKPPQGARFIKYAFDKAGMGANNLPMDQTLVQTFTCMASVGASGCGFEHQLESVYAALHNNLPENAGFVREGALLTIVFVTNEDDCSAPPDSDLFDKNKVQQYGFLSSYRCNRFGQVCGNPQVGTPYAESGGPLSNCGGAPNPGGNTGPGKLYDISRYINYFTKPLTQGGVKLNASDVILVGLDAPAEPVQVILSNPSTPGKMPYVQCGQLNETSSPPCVPVVQHSCQNNAQTEFFGDPAVRINAVINAAANHRVSSICDQDYAPALEGLAQLIVSNIGGGCIPANLPDVNDPDCVVEDVTRNPNGSTTVSEIPKCASPPSSYPCWTLGPKDTCASTSPQGVGITIDRNMQPAPDNTEASVACATVAG
ncbi:MAG: hypothetical protein EXR72_17820 [Myxococcales bacterium]|nr:hypothetical protein [Myxococcales bacterium]